MIRDSLLIPASHTPAGYFWFLPHQPVLCWVQLAVASPSTTTSNATIIRNFFFSSPDKLCSTNPYLITGDFPRYRGPFLPEKVPFILQFRV